MHVSLIHNLRYMWFCIDTFSLNNMLSYYTYTAGLWWWHTCTIIFSPSDIKPWNLCCPMPKAEGDITLQGFPFTEEQILYCCQRKQRRVQQSQWLWAIAKICDADIVNFGERRRAGDLLNTLQNNSMYMHRGFRIKPLWNAFKSLLDREECGIHW